MNSSLHNIGGGHGGKVVSWGKSCTLCLSQAKEMEQERKPHMPAIISGTVLMLTALQGIRGWGQKRLAFLRDLRGGPDDTWGGRLWLFFPVQIFFLFPTRSKPFFLRERNEPIFSLI